MKPPLPRDASPESYRRGYLKLKSVLYDRTTALPAFPVLFDDLRTLLDTRRELGVLHLEIANLETVESLYGWQVFDRIVARIARLLRECVGTELPPATLLALNGVAGDRFVGFVPEQRDGSEADGPFLASLGRAVTLKIEQAFDDDDFAGLSPRLSFRVGHALLSENPFFRFERCVYSAVEEARTSHDRRERRRDLSWGEELDGVIRGALVETVFQPIVELESRDVLGYEAFNRGPRDTIFEAPRAMFALSERLGVAVALDRVCLESALKSYGALAGEGLLFVNALPESLDDGGWRQAALLPLLEQLGLAPSDLVIEVSERWAGADPAPFVATLAKVKQQGFRLALDDVGTGRTGIAGVETLAPDFLKLDVSLVRHIDRHLIQQDLLQTLAGLAGRIDAALIAEGVESEEEALALARGGARYAQGYYFGRPSPADGES